MLRTASSSELAREANVRRKTIWQRIYAARYLFLMFLPGFALILVFDYGPMYGLVIAFKDFNISKGIWGSDWVGLKHFQELLGTPAAFNALVNTLAISLLKLIFGFPAPIILALLINELADSAFKRFTQSVSYLPHFISWVIIASIVYTMLSPDSGVINILLKMVGIKPIYFMTDPVWFRVTVIASNIWKEVGWGTIIYLAALAGINPALYEAAIIDGATRIQRMLYVSLPSIMPVVAIVTILSLGGILNAGFDQIFNLYNPRVLQSTDIIDTYVYRVGLVGLDFSFSTAVGLFKSLVGFILVIGVNMLVRRTSGDDSYTLW